MRSHLLLLAIVSLAFASRHPSWKDNTEYVYHVSGRTLTSLYELSDQYSGIFLKAKLHLFPRPDGKLQARISNAQYAQIHSHLPEGWNSNVPESQLSYKKLQLSDKPFQIVADNGVIKSLIVEKDLTNWEANVIKSIISQLQLDVQGKRSIKSSINIFPDQDKMDGVFKTMEETITGETETEYEIHRLPEYLIQSQPWLVPQHKLKGDGHVYELIKNKNYTNGEDLPAYSYGWGNLMEPSTDPTANRMGQFYTRQSSSRVILTGKLSKYTIQSSQTVNKIIIKPNLKEMGSSISALNVTLDEVKPLTQQPQEISKPVEIGNLVYTYEKPFAQSNEVREKMQGSRDESSEESNESSWQRVRRSAQQMLRKMQYEDSSSEELLQHQNRPVMSKAPESPLLPYSMGYKGRSIKTKSDFDIKQNLQRITEEISQDMRQPEKMLTQSSLSKYTLLCSLIRIMDEQEIRSVAQQLYSKDKQGDQRLKWVVFRDAVAEAGTGPAFLNVEEWITTRKIEKQEAAEIVASMAQSVRVPTQEYMEKFFELIKKHQIKSQEYLNETALLSFTSLVNRVNINKRQSYNQYPVHSFKPFYTKEGKEFTKNVIIPYLSQQLAEAVSQADSRKIHVYIRALGNVGHKKILEAFEPYLEGKQQVSQFQRMLMVLSMDKLVTSYPLVARNVLYRIYQNKAEIPEVRVVAVYQLIRTNPPVEMLQRMAQNTNIDVQEEVNAAVKSAIETASQLVARSHEAQILRKSAQSAKPLLTRKQYGAKQSQNILQDFTVRNMAIEIKQNWQQIGSVDSFWPKGLKYTVRGNFNGFTRHLTNVQAYCSSIKELTNVLYMQTDRDKQNDYQRSQEQSKDNKYSGAKIAETLNLETNEREQLEGFIYTEMEYLQRVWSFDNNTIKQLPQAVREIEEMLKNGKQFQYTKLKQLKQMTLALPTELGLPFLYVYELPVAIQFEGKVKAVATPEVARGNKIQKPQQLVANIDGSFTITTKVHTHLSLVTPFEHQMYSAGIDKNVQVHLPLKAKAEVDFENSQVKMEAELNEKHQNARLFHYSSWPYTSRSDILSLKPISLNSNTHHLKPQSNTHRSFNYEVGKESIGMGFRVWGHHPQESVNLWQLAAVWKSEGIATALLQAWDQSSMEQTEASIGLVPGQSRKFTVKLGYHNQYQSKPQQDNQEDFLSMTQFSEIQGLDAWRERGQQLLKHVSSGIKNVRSTYVHAGLEIEGDRKYEHILTLAYGKSNAAPQSNMVVGYTNNVENPTHACVQVKGYIPNTNGLDFSHSLNKEPKAKYEVLLQHSQGGQQPARVRATIDMTRSAARKNYLQESPMSYVCKKEMQQGNRQMSGCQNMTIESDYLDEIKVELQHENWNSECVKSIKTLFQGMRYGHYPLSDTKEIQNQGENKINLRVKFEPETLRQANITVQAKGEQTKLYNISIGQWGKTLCVPHPVFHLKARMNGQLMSQDNIRPTCVIDKSDAQTFSNRTYPLSLGEGWTLMMQYLPQEARKNGEQRQSPVEQLRKQQENFAVLVRELSENHKEMKLNFNHPKTEGKNVEVYVHFKQGSQKNYLVTVDGQEVHFDENKAADFFDGYLEIYALPNGETKMEIQDWFYIIYNEHTIKLTAVSDKLRDSIIGLCGRFSEDKQEDFWTPKNCIVQSPRAFVQAFKLEGQRQSIEQHECISKVLPLYTDIITHRDVGRSENYQESSNSGIKLRNRYVEDNGELCFTIHPVAQCKGIPRKTTTKMVPVHCLAQTKTAYYFKKQIDQGGNPDFGHKSESRSVEMEVAKEC